MIPAEFDYVAPDSLDEALPALADGGEDAKVLAGGHSLIPLMKLRLAAPSLLVDLRRVAGADGRVRRRRRHPLRRDDPPSRGRDRQLRARGRRGGDDRRPAGPQHGHDRRHARARRPGVGPAGDHARRGGLGDDPRRRPASARSRPPTSSRTTSTTAVGEGEILTVGQLPEAERATGTATRSSTAARRTGRWWPSSALVKKAGDGTIEDVRIGLTHMGSVPLRATAVGGRAARAVGGEDRRGVRAGRRGHRAARGPQRVAGLQAPPRARADQAGTTRPRHNELSAVSARCDAGLGRRGLPRRPGPRDVRLPRLRARAAAAARGRGGRGQDRGRAGAGRGDRRRADPPAVPRGDRPPPRGLRLGLPAPAAGDPRRRGGRRAARAVRARVPAAPAAAGGARARGRPGRAADRRDRPRRRRVRGVPARVPGRLRDHDPGAGDDRRRAPAAGDPHVEPHA